MSIPGEPVTQPTPPTARVQDVALSRRFESR